MRRIHTALGAAFVTGVLVGGSLVAAESAQAAVPVGTFAELQSAVTTGGTVTLGADITAASGQSLTVPLNTPVTLDLAGHGLTITLPGDGIAAVSVPAGASLTIADSNGAGTVTATGGYEGAGIGGNFNTSGGIVSVTGGTVTATGGQYGAGIGGGYQGAGGTVTVSGGTVTATGGQDAAGIGGAESGAGGSLTVSGGTVTASGGYGSPGIGGARYGDGGSVTIGAAGTVTANGGVGASAVGAGAGGSSFGSLSDAGSLTIPAGATLTIPPGVTVSDSGTLNLAGSLVLGGVLSGGGTVVNTGVVLPGASGDLTGVTVTGFNFTIGFSVNGGSSEIPGSLHVYAASLSDAGLALPADPTPPTGSSFVGWFTAETGGTQVSNSTDLSTLFATGPTSATLYARYQVRPVAQSITFPTIADVTYGVADFHPGATATSGLAVSYSVETPSVCTIMSRKVHVARVGTCTVDADQPGSASYSAAPTVSQSFTVTPARLTVTASSPSLVYGVAPPAISASYIGFVNGDTEGSLTTAPTCLTTVTSVSPVGTYASTCSGAVDPNYTISYVNGTVTVTAAPVVGCVTAPFPDVPVNGRFCGDIAWLVRNKITTGYADGRFRPTTAVDRQQMAAFLFRTANPGEPAPVCTTAMFSDVPISSPFCGDIAWLVRHKITSGYADGRFRPTTAVDRQQMAAFLFRVANPGALAPGCTSSPFSDVPISSPFCGDIAWLASHKITIGYADGRFHPTTAVTREAMAAFLQRAASIGFAAR